MAIAGTAPATVAGQGQSLPPAMKLEQDVVSWTESLYSQATEDKDREREIKDSLKIIDYLEGKQWADKARFARSRPVINKFQRHFWESVGLLTDLALDFNVKLFDKLNDYCYDSETEILTRNRGFVLFKDLLQTDYVATRSSAGEFQWQKPSIILNKPYSGPMLQFASKGINLKVTPKHRMLISRSRKAGWVEEVVTAEAFADGLNHSRKVPVTSSWQGEEIGERHFSRTFRTGRDVHISGDDFCALLGAYIAEGSICKQGGIAVSQLKTSKGYTEYKELFDRLGGEYNGRQFVLHPRALTEYFKQFGHAHEKFVPEIIRNATPQQIAIFLHFYGLGDGCFRPKRNISGRGSQPNMAPHYTTVSRRLADHLVELVQKAGYSSATYVKPAYKQAFHVKGVKGKVYDYICDCRESYVITTRHSKQMGVKVQKTEYAGTIHCVTVPNGIVYVRRNGKPSWCGNSEFEHILNELAVHWAENNSFEDRLYDVVLYGLLHSGYAKLQWNSSLNGGMGDVDLIPIAPWNIAFVGGNGQNLQQCEANIYFHVVTLEHLYRTFGETARRVKGDSEYSGEGSFGGTSASLRPAHISKESWARIQGSPLQKILAGSATPEDATQYPMVMQKEFWIKDASVNERSESIVVGNPLSNWSYLVEPGMALYPRGRVITTAGGCVLGDDPNPYWHARFPFSAFKPYRVPWKVSGVCYDDQTEVLTRRGWLRFADVREVDEFATRQIQTGWFEWQRSCAYTCESYDGDMYNFTAKSLDICVTPEHRMLVNSVPWDLGNQGGINHGRKEGVITAKQLAEYGTHHTQIPQTSVWVGTEIGSKNFALNVAEYTDRYLSRVGRVGKTGMTEKCAKALAGYIGKGKPLTMSGDDYCAFMGAYLSEGWRSQHSVYITQYKESKGYKPFKRLLDRIFGKAVAYDGVQFTMSRKALSDYVGQFGQHCDQKFIPDDIMNATSRQLRIFWRYFMLGDGSYELDKRPRKSHGINQVTERITTTSHKLADQLMEVAQKFGLSASVRLRKPSTKPHMICGKLIKTVRASYVVSLRTSQAMAGKPHKFNYVGNIYCVTVPNGFIYVRRNGKPAWSGNSPTKPWIQMSNIMNRIYGGLLDQVNSIIEPSLIAPKAAFPAADWDSLDPGASGAKIKYNNNSPRPPEFAKKADLPSYIFTYLQEISKEYEMSSSASAVGQALSKKQVPGGDAIEQIISSRSFPMKVQSRGLTSFIKDIGYMGISDMLQFYSVAHRQAILGTKGITDSDFRPIYGQARPSGMKGEDFVRKFQFIIKPGSTLAVEKDDKIKYAFALSKLGKLSDRGLYRQLDQNFDFNRNQKELLEEAKIKLLVAGAAAAVTGKGGKK